MAHIHANKNFNLEKLETEFENMPKPNRSEYKLKKGSENGRITCSRLAKRLESSDGRYDTAYQLLLNIKAGTFEFMSEDDI